MSTLWLAPVMLQPSVTISRMRFIPQPEQEFERFRTMLQARYPRLLMLFKTHLLLSDDTLEACGSEDAVLELDSDLDIVFDDESGTLLSHCAEAFIDRLSTSKEGLAQLRSIQIDETWPVQSSTWLSVIENWLSEGYQVMLLKEE